MVFLIGLLARVLDVFELVGAVDGLADDDIDDNVGVAVTLSENLDAFDSVTGE